MLQRKFLNLTSAKRRQEEISFFEA